MASHDTEGTINHGGWYRHGMSLLFFDSHLEFRSADDLDPASAAGRKGGLLWQLRN